MSQFKALTAALDMLNYPKADHDPRCLSLKPGQTACNCWSYSYRPGMDADATVFDEHCICDCPDNRDQHVIAEHPKEIKSMAASLPSVDTTSIEAKHQSFLTGFAMRTKSLNDRVARVGITRTIAEEAQELDTDAKRWLDSFETETKPIKDQLFKAHRMFTGFCEKLSGGATAARQTARKLIGAYQLEQQRIADEKRREAERLAREEAERQRQAEVDARMAEAAEAEKAGNPELAEFITQEALDAEQAPAIPVSVPEAPSQKIEGSSTSFKLVGAVDEGGAVRLLCFYLGVKWTEEMEERADPFVREAIGIVKEKDTNGNLTGKIIYGFSPSGLQDQLARGLKLQDYGVRVQKRPTTRNLSGR